MDRIQQLSDDPLPNRQIGTSDIPTALAYKLGELVTGLSANTDAVSKLVESVGRMELSNSDMKKDFEVLSLGLAKANTDLMEMTKAIAALGIDADTKKDMTFLRQERIARDDRKPMNTLIISGVVVALVIAACTWIASASFNQARNDLSKAVQIEQKGDHK